MSKVRERIESAQRKAGRRGSDPFYDLFSLPEKRGCYELYADCLIDMLRHNGCPAIEDFVSPGNQGFVMKNKYKGSDVVVWVSFGLHVDTIDGCKGFGFGYETDFLKYIQELY